MLKRIPMNRWRRFWHSLSGCSIQVKERSWQQWMNAETFGNRVDGYCVHCLQRFIGEPWADCSAGGCNSGSGIDWREDEGPVIEHRRENKLRRVGVR